MSMIENNEIRISSSHPGGNILVTEKRGNIIKLEQDLRDTTEWWFYWNFCAEAETARSLEFVFSNGEVIGPWGPAISHDCLHWQWIDPDCILDRSRFRYHFTGNNTKTFFAFSLPYQVENWQQFVKKYKQSPAVDLGVLCRSELGRLVPLARIGNRESKKDIVFTCRHHACESTAGYLLEGILLYFIENKPYLLDDYHIHVIPFVDIDGVENGDQGKSRHPHDHNRDYLDEPIYRAVEAIQAYLKGLNVVIGVDLHSPYKWGGRNDYPFFVKQAAPLKERIEQLSESLHQITVKNASSANDLIFEAINDIDPGVEWNTGDQPTCGSYFAKCGAHLAFTFEFPYFGRDGKIVTPDSSRGLGRNLAQALEEYLTREEHPMI